MVQFLTEVRDQGTSSVLLISEISWQYRNKQTFFKDITIYSIHLI